MKRMRFAFLGLVVVLFSGLARAQWNPPAGQWGKTDPRDLRVMTWNIDHGICSTNNKVDGANQWSALVRIIASVKPDVLLLQEAGDNLDNGTGSNVDSPADLETTVHLLIHGGADPFKSHSQITSYVQFYAPGYDLPFVFASSANDGFERNVIASRYPFKDLNGDGQATLSDIPSITADLYAPGGNGGIRGYMTAEIDLPDALYAGDVVIGNSHLKAGSNASDQSQRLTATKNIAYFIDYFFNGAGTGAPDPHNKIADSPSATSILNPMTPLITGGDFNEDQLVDSTNNVKGPAAWIAQAASADSAGGGDGTDRDRTDMTFDIATDPFTGSVCTIGAGTTKFDYFVWQDSLSTLRRAFVFNSATVTPASAMPTELVGYLGGAASASLTASDHKPVIADFILMPALGCNTAAQNLGFAKVGGGGTYPTFEACGVLSSGGSATLTLGNAAPSSAAFAVLSLTPGQMNLFGGTLVPDPPSVSGPIFTDVGGQIILGPIPGGLGPLELYWQWGILDPAATQGVSFSNALKVSLLP